MSSQLGNIYIDGIASGIDTSAIIQQVAEVQQAPVDILEERKLEQTERLTTYQSLNAMLMGLQTSAGTLTSSSAMLSYAASSSSTSVAVSVDGSAGPGSYDMVVTSLATTHKMSGSVVADDTEALGYEGDIIINGEAIAIESSDDLNELAFKVNMAGAGVWATVIDYAEDDHRLVLSGHMTGAENSIEVVDANDSDILESLGLLNSTTSIKTAISNGAQSDGFTSASGEIGTILGLTTSPAGTVNIDGTDVAIDLSSDTLQEIASRITSTVAGVTANVTSNEVDGEYTYCLEIVGGSGTPTFTDSNNILNTLGILTKDIANEIQAATDAELTVEGVDITRSTNSISDLIDGVTLDLASADPATTVTITVQQDADTTFSQVNQFINNYNTVIDNLRAGQTWDSETAEGGDYFGDPAIQLLEDGLHGAIMTSVDTLGGDMYLPSHVGISTDQYGHLVLDTETFESALWENPLGLCNMFGTAGNATDADITYVSSVASTAASGADGYAVEITQVAEKAAATSATLASGITVDETLTFQDVCTVQLTNGMSLNDAAEELNSRFQLYDLAISASVDGDTLVIEHDNYGNTYGFTVKSSLDNGAGGLDIAGATAGVSATHTGVDVAGTINGEECTGNGRYLTGKSGNENTDGLMIRVDATTTGSHGVVKVSQGMASRLQRYIGISTDSENGSITIATQHIENDIDAIDEEIERIEESIESYLSKLRSELLAMETAIAEAESMQDYITNQLKGMTTSYGSSSDS